MRKIVLTFGLIAGAILSAMMLITLPFQDRIGFDKGWIIGYTSMVAAFLMVFWEFSCPALRMALDLVCTTAHCVNPAAVCFPAWDPACKAFVGVGKAAVGSAAMRQNIIDKDRRNASYLVPWKRSESNEKPDHRKSDCALRDELRHL